MREHLASQDRQRDPTPNLVLVVVAVLCQGFRQAWQNQATDDPVVHKEHQGYQNYGQKMVSEAAAHVGRLGTEVQRDDRSLVV